MSAVNPLEEPGGAPELPKDEPAPALEAPKFEEPKAEADPAKEPEKAEPTDREKYENLQRALREERRERAAMRQQVEETTRKLAAYDALKAELDERRKAQQAEAERKAFEDNPAEYLRKQVEETQENVRKVVQTTEQQRQEYEQQQAMLAAIQSQTIAFANETPDYNDAFAFMRERRMMEYDILGVPPEYREQQFNTESMQFAQAALQNGRNPAELAYNMAKAWGFQAKPKAAPADPNAAIARLEEGKKAAATLSRGGQPEESLLKRIDDMSDKEFETFWETEMVPKHR